MKIKKMISRYPNVFRNLSYLSIFEILRLIFPLITVPFLITKLGKFNYGSIAYMQAITAYATILINLGLDLSSVKDIACNRENKRKMEEIFSSVMIIKFSLFFLVFCLFCGLIFIIPLFMENKAFTLFTLSYCLMEITIPIWYYQGVEKMKYITIIKLIVVIVYTLLVLLFIRKPEDYPLVPLFYGIGAVIGGALSYYIILQKEKIRFYFPGPNIIFSYVKSTMVLFYSRLSVVINTTFAKLITGTFLGMEQVALLDLLEKVINIAKIPLTTINNAIYPHIAKTKDKIFAGKVFKWYVGVSILISVVVMLFAKPVLSILSNGVFTEYSGLLQFYALHIILCGFTFYLGVPILVSFGYNKKFTLSVIYSTLLLIMLYTAVILAGYLTLFTCLCITLFTEMFILFYRFYYYKKYLF